MTQNDDSTPIDSISLPPPIKHSDSLLPIYVCDSLRHAASVIEHLVQGTLVSSIPGQPPSPEQIKAAFNRIRYDIDLAERQLMMG